MHIDSGETVDRDEAHAWMATDKGKAFMRDSADKWREAHVRSGEDPATAAAAAERTAAFYTGEA